MVHGFFSYLSWRLRVCCFLPFCQSKGKQPPCALASTFFCLKSGKVALISFLLLQYTERAMNDWIATFKQPSDFFRSWLRLKATSLPPMPSWPRWCAAHAQWTPGTSSCSVSETSSSSTRETTPTSVSAPRISNFRQLDATVELLQWK